MSVLHQLKRRLSRAVVSDGARGARATAGSKAWDVHGRLHEKSGPWWVLVSYHCFLSLNHALRCVLVMLRRWPRPRPRSRSSKAVWSVSHAYMHMHMHMHMRMQGERSKEQEE